MLWKSKSLTPLSGPSILSLEGNVGNSGWDGPSGGPDPAQVSPALLPASSSKEADRVLWTKLISAWSCGGRARKKQYVELKLLRSFDEAAAHFVLKRFVASHSLKGGAREGRGNLRDVVRIGKRG